MILENNMKLLRKCQALLLIMAVFCSLGLRAQEPKLVLPIGHPEGILQVTGTPNGKYIFSRSFNDLNVRIWSTETGMMVAEIKTVRGAVDMIPSADSKYLLIKSREIINYWDIENNKSAFQISNGMNGVVLSGDDRYIMGNHYKQLFIYQTLDGKKTFEKTMEDTICSFDFMKNNQILVVSKNKNTRKFMFYDILDDSLISEFELKDLGDWQFYKCEKYDIIISNNSKYIRRFNLSVVDHTIYKEKKRKSLGSSNGNIDFCPLTGKYLIGFPKKNTIQVVDPDSSSIYYRNDFKDFTSAVFVNNGKNIAVKTENNYALEYFNDKLEYCNMLFANDVGDFKNAPAPIFYHNKNKKFYAVLDDNIIREFESDADTCKQIRAYKGETSGVTDFACTGDTLYISNGSGSIKKIILSTGTVIDDFKISDYPITAFNYNKINGSLTAMDFTHQEGIFGSREKKRLHSFTYENEIKSSGYFRYPIVDIAGNHLLMGFCGFKYSNSSDGLAYYELRDNESLKVLKKKTIEGNIRGSFRLNNFGNEIIYCNQSDSTVSIKDLDFKTLRVIKINGWVMHARQSKTGKYLIVSSENSTINYYDYTSGNLLYQFPSLLDNDVDLDISPNDSLLIFNSDRGSIEVWDVKSGKKLGPFLVHEATLVKPFFIDNNRFVTISEDGFLKYWKINKQGIQQIFSLVPFQNTDYAVLVPTGYYKCTSNAAKFMHYITDGIKVLTFEQLDVKYNRPDLVLASIGNTDTALIASYHHAYLKRIKKLSIDTTSFTSGFSIPESGFKEETEYEQKQQKLKIHLWYSDTTFKIDRFNVWINDSPLWGQKGISLRNRNKNNFDTVVEITLSDGKNRIETSMMNINGVESYRRPIYVNYNPDNLSTYKTYFIGIGIDHFKDSTNNLTWSSKDIRDMSIALKSKYGNDIVIDTLFNQNVTTGNVRAIKAILLNSTVNDRVIIAYSGHGLLNNSFDYYLSTYNVNFAKPEQGGLAYEDLENLLDSIPARKKLLMIDACHSGELDKEEMFRIATVSNDTSLHLAFAKGPMLLYKKSAPKLGTKNSFELMNDLFVNVSKGTGATVIAASAGTQFALETNELQNGVFTFCFLQMLKSKQTCSVQELKKNISTEVERKTNGAQKPTSRSETSNFDWGVW